MASAEEEGRRLFVGGLSVDTTDTAFRAHFASFFPVAHAEVKRRADGKTRLFGFVTFTSAEAAEQVFAMPSHVIDGKTVEIRRATSQITQASAGTEGSIMPTDPKALVMRKLLLTGLSKQTTKQDIMTYFAHCGEIQSVHMSGGRKAEVVFTQPEAVDTVQLARPHSLGGTEVETCRAAPVHMFGKPEADIKTLRVFLGPPEGSHKGLHGLGEEISDQDLCQYFGQFGEVQNVRQVLWEDTGKKKGYGHVEMTDTDQVDKIILVRIHTLKGRQIEAKKALTREQMEQCGVARKEGRGLKRGGGEESDHMGVKRTRGGKLATPRDPEDPAMRKMFAGNLHKDTTQEALKAFFSEFGEVEQCYCAMNKTTGKCKGYGFVTYRQSEAVDAIQSSRPHSLLDREVDTRRAVPRELAGNPESEMRSKKLYITGLHGPKSGLNENISDADLREYFGQFGAVLNVSQKLHSATAPQTDPSKVGKKTGYGYIEFADEDPVDKLVLIGVIQLKGAILEARRGLTREQQEEVKSKQHMMYSGGDQYFGGNHGGGDMQGIMADMQSKMAGAGMGGMAGQMGKMSSMVAGMDGAGGALSTSLNGMLKGMQGMMNALDTTPELAASMGAMMVSMMEMCQQMMLTANKQKRQQAASSGEQYSSGAWGGGYGAGQGGYYGGDQAGYGGSSQAGYGTSGYSDYYGTGSEGYGSSSQGSYGSGYAARPDYGGNSSWKMSTRGKTEPKSGGSSRGRGNYSGY